MYWLKNITKKLIAIILIILMIVLVCSPKVTLATETNQESDSTVSDVEAARMQIANWAIAFARGSEAGKCTYTQNFADRANTYTRPDPQAEYRFDCVGWVNYAVNRAIEITYSEAEDGSGGFVTPQSGIKDTSHFAYVSINEIQPGDILIAPSAPHVAIYVGNYQIVDMLTIGLALRTISSSYTELSWTACTYTRAARLKSADGANFSPIEGGEDLELEENPNWTQEEVDLDKVAEQFTFDGMPPTMIYQDEKVDVFRWIFDGISGFMDFIAGLLISFIKMPILGFAAMFDNFIDSLISGMN